MSPVVLWSALVGLLLVLALTLIKSSSGLRWRPLPWIFAGTLVLLLVALASPLLSYSALQYGRQVAVISFTQVGPRRFQAELSGRGLPAGTYILQGDEWQLDAAIIKWRGLPAWLEMAPLYRFDRLSGRYRDVADELSQPRTVYDLNPVTRWPAGWSVPWQDIWQGVFVDARYGSGTFLPMANGAVYGAAITTSGLMARPLNDEARGAVRHWFED